jgi:superoxide dismutase, Cu-Zn family
MKLLTGIFVAVLSIPLAVVGRPAIAGETASARMIDPAGHLAGQANFKAAPHGVLIEIAVKGLAPGPHAVLLHTKGACDPAAAFASAGPVFDFDLPRPHGYFARGGPKPGDLPVQFAGPDGTLHATIYTTAFSLGNGKRSIFDADGVSIVVHAASDDYRAQPDGRAGAPLACGTILRTPGPKTRK